jgi:hypothetical protein
MGWFCLIVSFWHFSAVPTALSNVGYWGAHRKTFARSELFSF